MALQNGNMNSSRISRRRSEALGAKARSCEDWFILQLSNAQRDFALSLGVIDDILLVVRGDVGKFPTKRLCPVAGSSSEAF